MPFGDTAAVERVLTENRGEVAGMIIEPIMMNIGLIPPPPGYLSELRALLHRHGAYLAFDEVKTGLAVAPGGAIEWSGVTPDLVCLAKALGGGVPCGAIGGTAELMGLIADGSYEQVGTFNGNPLTMASARAVLTEILTDDAYRHFDRLRSTMVSSAEEILAPLRPAGSRSVVRREGRRHLPRPAAQLPRLPRLSRPVGQRALALPAQRRRLPAAVGQV